MLFHLFQISFSQHNFSCHFNSMTVFVKPMDNFLINMYSGKAIRIHDWNKINDLFCTVISWNTYKKQQIFGPFDSKDLISRICFYNQDYLLNFTYEGDKEIKLKFETGKCENKNDKSLFDKIDQKYDPFYEDIGGYGSLTLIMFFSLFGLYILIFWLKCGYVLCKCCKCCRR